MGDKFEKNGEFEIENAAGVEPGFAGDQEEETPVVKEVLPCVALRGVTVFPNTVVHFDIGREKSMQALDRAMATDKLLFVSSQKSEKVLIPTSEDIYNVGTVVRVKQMLKIQGDVVRVLVEGLSRAIMDECVSEERYISCSVTRSEDEVLSEEDLSVNDQAEMRMLTDAFVEYAALSGQISDEVVNKILELDDPVEKVDRISNELLVPVPKKQKILEALVFSDRIHVLNTIIAEENEIAVVEKSLSEKVKKSLDKGQKDYYLREKIRVIEDELGDGDDTEEETEKWLKQLEELKLDPKIEAKVKKEINKFSKMQGTSAESAVIRNYVETILDLPWHKSSETNKDLKKAEKILDAEHYGMKDVKERIMEYLAVTKLTDSIRGPILCLVGPPGVGKTSIAKSIAKATGREYVRMSLGGVSDEAQIRGHMRTYIGAIPGRIIDCIRNAGTNNPLFLFDEIDKLGADYKGDPSSAMLEVLDPEQNSTFTDNFLEIPFDLSKVMFITTANNADTIPEPLLDRMELIEVPGYTELEKVKIAEKYLIPKQIKENGLKNENIKFTDGAIHDLINYYTRESGVRSLEREIGSLCRKVAKKVVTEDETVKYSITKKNLVKYLGKHRFSYDVVKGKDKVGVVTGLAWTAVGGVTLQIETITMPGQGKIELTGKMGDVMQESARIGISYVRSIADKLGIDPDFNKKNDLHIHIPEGAVPKDGPSAGVTMCTSIVSAVTGRPVRRDVAMTGEIDLEGDVLPVGGIREKMLAAHRAGIKQVLVPKENEPDIEELPAQVKEDVEFTFLDNIGQALEIALDKEKEA
ncbi:MAG: endopeptidase La [Eubacteriales bacterium]|nr:endopeptidase La [Eubacteriales bacterium]